MPSFLQPLLRDPSRAWTLINVDSGARVAGRVTAAVDSATRRRGLLGRTALEDEALVIAPCNAVHTFFMRFSIDVIFVDRDGHVTRAATDVAPWRLTGALRAFATIEVPSGTVARTSTQRGHRLELRAR